VTAIAAVGVSGSMVDGLTADPTGTTGAPVSAAPTVAPDHGSRRSRTIDSRGATGPTGTAHAAVAAGSGPAGATGHVSGSAAK
jgi:hypothetical protein